MSDEDKRITPTNTRLTIAHRVVQIALVIALLWKIRFFRMADDVVHQDLLLHDPFFPEWLQHYMTLRIAFLAAVSASVVSLIGTSFLRKICALITITGTTVLCLHQGSHNDMTFVTAWWVSLWNLWFVFHLDDEDSEQVMRRAAFLSRLIISMILLGGAVGKWTGEYWNGDVFYDIYFRDRDFWVFNYLREWFEPETLREIATYYSRKVVILETVAGFGLWLLPAKWAAAVAIVILASIALFSNILLFSVLMSLIGLASVGFFVRRPVADD